MPSADFCTAVRGPRGSLSPYRTRCRSPGVSLTAFTAHLPNLQPGPEVDTGLRGYGPTRPTQTASLFGSCPSGRGFASALPSDDTSRSSPLRLASPLSPPDLGRGLAPPSCQACPAHPPYGNPQSTRIPTRGLEICAFHIPTSESHSLFLDSRQRQVSRDWHYYRARYTRPARPRSTGTWRSRHPPLSCC